MSATYARPPRPTSRRAVAAALAAVPLAWCAAAVAVIRPDAIAGRADVPYALKWLLYDESDLTALALRGANAHMGRTAGRMDEPPLVWPADLAAALDRPALPLADRYYLEYPTPTLPLFRLGFLGEPRTIDLIPAAVADSQQFSVGFFEPRDPAESAVWSKLRRGVIAVMGVMAFAHAGLILILCRGYGAGTAAPWAWLAVLPGAVFFAVNRFDVLPVFFTAAGFALLARRRDGWSGAAFGIAALLKIYPVLLAPLILRYVGMRRGAVWLVAFAGTGLAVMGYSVYELGWEATEAPIRVQLSRPFIPENWSLYGVLLPEALARSGPARLAILAAAVGSAAWGRPAGFDGLLRRCAAVLVVFAVLAVFWSPQWILWFLPLLAPLAPRRRWVGVAVVAQDAINYFSFPLLFWRVPWLGDGDGFGVDVLSGTMTVVRGLAWAGLGAGLVYDEWRAARAARVVS